jgi:acyl-homoserine lactone acylase PvdQ/ketosteroid isomerase-like protein
MVALGASAPAQELPGTGPDAGKTVIYRDTWGVPHIYAPTAAQGMFAMGWAQAEDRPEEVLKNLMRGIGESAVFEGEGGIQSDMVANMWRHYELAKSGMDTINPTVREHMDAFAAGINAFYAAHPTDVPTWWGDRKVDAAMVVAFGRFFLYSWSTDDGFGDLARAGIEPGMEEVQRGSNSFAVSPQRSASGDAILYVDPHLAWFGAARFWEMRIHAGELVGSGFGLAGVPYIGLGHNANMAWAMTTGAPDTADVYALTLNPDNPLQYQYDGAWRDITTREITIQVKDAAPVTMTLYDCHYGPVVAMKDGKAYSVKTAYADVVTGNEAWYLLNTAKDYTGAVAAMKTGTMFPQNVMVADQSGNIYYQRTGRVPKRPDGFDFDRPVDGSTSKSEWLGIHDSDDHVQILNPEQGYMQCCNIPPDALMVKSPLTPDKYPGYIFSDLGYGERGGWTNQRGGRAVELLHNDDSVTIEEAKAYALDVHPFGVERWIEVLRKAHEAEGDRHADDLDYVAGMKDILAWDLEERRYSTGALKYHYWRKQLMDDYGPEIMQDVQKGIDQYYKIITEAAYTPLELGSDEAGYALESFAKAMAKIRDDFGTIDVPWGEKFRVGRDELSWPVDGGDDQGTTTLRNVGYGKEREDHTEWGNSGQTSTQIIVLSNPVQSWTAPPIGQSDRPDSPHYRDQAEKVFSKRIMKPTWWTPEELAKNIESRVVLETGLENQHIAELKERLAAWEKALEAQQYEATLAFYAEDLVGEGGRGKADFAAFLQEAIAGGMLSGLDINIDHSKITGDAAKSRVAQIEIEGTFGAMNVALELEKRDGVWLITKSENDAGY